MTSDEIRANIAGYAFMEAILGKVAREGANWASAAEALAHENAKLREEIAKLKAPADNVVPIEGTK